MDNAQLAVKMLHSLGKDMDFFWMNAHPDLVLEFPYAPWVGLPDRLVGREDIEAYLDNFARMLPGLTFTDVRVWPYAEEDAYVLEYNGTCPSVNSYKQRYINISRFKDGKLILFREFWNTTEALRAFGGTEAIREFFTAVD
ncbi:nuclear transport factor 2 family protein [Streptomyces sp. MA5143a]|uniref:nuclear transport factor 2 family protein n=1 Tax=Streptomyces sp. MA5143a TaxID=2083010 RepID=UPI000D2C36F7|nr:nuclear transport factor 2 family protein [Streptomyces sp. MA5143a]SPF06205.1 putative PhzA/B-like protein [Streptomyces sp. MA5143a]